MFGRTNASYRVQNKVSYHFRELNCQQLGKSGDKIPLPNVFCVFDFKLKNLNRSPLISLHKHLFKKPRNNTRTQEMAFQVLFLNYLFGDHCLSYLVVFVAQGG